MADAQDRRRVLHYRSGELNKKPLAANIKEGELAVNYNKDSVALYTKDSAGNIVNIAGSNYVTIPDYLEAEAIIAETFVQIANSTGLDENGEYVVPENVNYIKDTTSIVNALQKLDNSISNDLDVMNGKIETNTTNIAENKLSLTWL